MTRASAFALIVITAELIGAWLFGLCTNKLFLFFLATSAVTLIVAVPRRALMMAGLPFVIALVLAGRLWVKPAVTHFSFNRNVVEIPGKEEFRYPFDLEPLLEKRERCQSSDAKLVIHGKNLGRLKIDLNGVEQTPARIQPFYGFDHLFLDLPSGLSRFTVTMRRGEDTAIPSIYVGPQFRDNSLYAEAVFVVSENTQCRLVLHSRRSCKEKCPEILESLSSEVLKVN